MTYDLTALKGSIPPLITPFRDGAVDYDGYARLVDFQAANGSHGVLVNGTTAEPSTLTVDERNRIVDVAVRAAAGRLPLVVNTGSQSLAETQALTQHAVRAGADALLVVTPYYIKPPQRGLIAYYREVMRGYDVPWMIYHIPGRTAVGVTLETVVELARTSSNFVGMKHAVNDLGFVSECLDVLPDFKIFVGLEELSFPMMTVGGAGLMNAVGNLNPRVLADMCDAVWDGDLSRGRGVARAAPRSQQSGLLRHESDSDQIHDEAARTHRAQRTPVADGAGHAGTREAARRRARPLGSADGRVKLLSFRADGTTSFGAVVDGGVVDLGARFGDRFADLRALIEANAETEAASATQTSPVDYRLDEIAFAPPIPVPEKIFCIGVNYTNRNEEYKDGSEAPTYPSIFMRTPGSLVGHLENVVRPPESPQLDYEGEIVIVIGKRGRRIPRERARDHVAGLTCMNEGTIRDWVRHGKFNVTQGKNFTRSGSVGPWIVTTGDLGDFGDLRVTTRINGELRQNDTTASLAFPFDRLIAYVSTFCELAPGDIIATGTPVGAGARFDPPKWLVPGDRIEVEVQGVGVLSNGVVDETSVAAAGR